MKNRKLKLSLNFLSNEECNKIINSTYDVHDLKNKILNEIKENFVTEFKGFDIGEIQSLKLNKHDEKQKYNDFEVSDNDTYLSFLVQLNDEYTGGYFQFLVDDGNRYYQVHHGSGHLIIHFSDLPKRTTPVTNGVKYTLTGSISLIKKDNNENTLL